MRCFVAVELPEELKRKTGGIIDQIGTSSDDIRWVPLENIHLTLKFLGEIKDNIIAGIERKLEDICRIHKPFHISVKGTGAFPTRKNPNILWVGIEKSEELHRLHTDIDNSMSELGFEKENRKHSPHLTIGRVKHRGNMLPVMKSLHEFRDTFFGVVDVNEVHLMKSTLKSSGAEYSKITSFRLGGKIKD